MDFDVLIVGGGLVGASFAAALRGCGLRIGLVDAGAAQVPVPAGWDTRVYAISPGSVAFLERCGAWQRLPPARREPVCEMRIRGDAAGAELTFSAYDAGLAELCFIVDAAALESAIGALLDDRDDLTRYAGCRPAAMDVSEHAVRLQLEDGRQLESALVVGADGAESWVRESAGIRATPRPYRQCGVIANFETSEPHRQTAFQWFRGDGVLALLPLPGNRVSMVWSTRDAHADALLQMDPGSLVSAVGDASGHLLGNLRLVSRVQAFPLRLLRVRELVRPRLALIGDAAHNVHPLAGQGVNLGFEDARDLAAVIAARGRQDDCGDHRLLRRYERSRKEDIAAMQLVTDGLQRLFDNRLPGLRPLRNAGLRLTDGLPLLKNLLVKQALG